MGDDRIIEYDGRFYWNCPTCSTSISSTNEPSLETKAEEHQLYWHGGQSRLKHQREQASARADNWLAPALQTTKLQPGDPAYSMKFDKHRSVPVIFKEGCYICVDSEFAQLGMPLCSICCKCNTGHVPADSGTCDDCGWECNPHCYDKHGRIQHPPLILCTCDRPCCEVDVGVGVMLTCEWKHCPVHGDEDKQNKGNNE